MTLANALRQRALLTQHFGARKPRVMRKPRVQPMRFPSAVRLSYLRGIRDVLDTVRQALAREVLPELEALVSEHAATRGDAAQIIPENIPRRIAIVGAPRAGKTTAALELAKRFGLQVHHSDDLIGLGWTEASGALAEQIAAADSGIFEGVAVVRALRKMLAAGPDKPVDQVLVLRQPRLALSTGQARMAAACETMLQEIMPELVARGVEFVDDPALLQPVSTESAERTDEASSTVKGLFDKAAAWVAGQYPPKRIALLAQQNALRVQDNVVTQVDGAIKRVVKIDVFAPTSGVADHVSAFVAQNVVLIKNLTEQTLAQTHATLLEGLRGGLRAEEIKKNLRDKVELSETKATILANDQVGKLHGELTQLRQQSLGLKRYTWATSRDELVRPGHRALDGVVCRWDEPPVVNDKTGLRAHPGFDTHFYPCRCSAIPMLDDVLQEAGLLPANDVVPDALPPVPRTLPQPEPANVSSPAALLADALEEQAQRKLPELVTRAVSGLADTQLDYLREGMRDLSAFRGAYAGATRAEATAIASGLLPSKNTGKLFEPIKLSSDVSDAALARGRSYELVDGRHRLQAAREAGARFILALVNGKRVIIRVPVK